MTVLFVFLVVVAYMLAAVVLASLLGRALHQRHGDVADRTARRMLGAASSDDADDRAVGVLLSMDCGRIPHERRHGLS